MAVLFEREAMKREKKKILPIIIITMLLIFGLAYAVIINQYMVTQKELERSNSILSDSAREQARIFETKIECQFGILESFREYMSKSDFDANGTVMLLNHIVKAGNFYQSGFSYLDGKAVINGGFSIDISQNEYFKTAVLGKRSIGYVPSSQIGKKALFVCAIPMYEDEKISGVFFGSCEADGFVPLLISEAYGGKGYSFICDSEGHLLVQPESDSFIWKYYFREDSSATLYKALETVSFDDYYSLDEMKENISKGKGGTFSYHMGNRSRYGIYEPLGYNNWYIYNAIDADMIHYKIKSNTQIAVSTSIIVLMCAMVAAVYFVYNERRHQKLVDEEKEKLIEKEAAEKRVILEHNERFRIAFKKLVATTWDYDLITHEITQSDLSEEWHGFEKIIKNVPQSFVECGYIHSDSVNDFLAMYDKLFAGEPTAEGVFRVQSLDRQEWWYEHIQYVNLFDINGKPYKAIGMGHDVTEQHRLAKEVKVDPLTGLLNHKATIIGIKELLKGTTNEITSALFMIDVDNFKEVNDTLGHKVGDDVLVRISEIIKAEFCKDDVVGRIGGDEYLVLMSNISSTEEAEKRAADLVSSLQMNCNIGDEQVTLSSSVGVAIHNERESYDSLYLRADKALYRAKNAGRNRYNISYKDEEKDEKICVSKAKDEKEQEGLTTIQLQTLLEDIDGGVILFDVSDDIKLRYISPSFYKITGLTAEDVKNDGRIFLDMIPKKYRDELELRLYEAAENNTSVDFSYPVKDISGKAAWRHLRAVTAKHDNDKNHIMIGMITDITEIKQNSDLLEGIISNTPIGIGVFDGSVGFKPVFVNKIFLHMIKRSREEFFKMSGDNALRLIAEEDSKKIEPLLRRLKNGDKPQTCIYHAVSKKDENARIMSAQGVNISREGEGSRYLVLVKDITNQTKLSNSLAQSSKEAAKEYESIRMKFLFERSALESFEVNIADRSMVCSKSTQLKNNFPTTEFENIPDSIIALGVIHEDSIEPYKQFYTDMFSGVSSGSCVLRVKMKDETYSLRRIEYQTIYDSSGVPLRAIGFSESIGHENALKFAFDQEETLYELMGERYIGAFRINITKNHIEYICPDRLREILPMDSDYDVSLKNNLGKYAENAQKEALFERFCSENIYRKFKDGEKGVHYGFRVIINDKLHWILYGGLMHISPYNGDLYFFAYIRDIDEIKKLELALKQKPQKNPSTGLYRKQTMKEIIMQACKNNQATDGYCGVMVMRIMNYAKMQYEESEESFESLMYAIIRKIYMCTNSIGIVGELADDRVIIFCPNVASESQLQEYAGKIMTVVNSANFLTFPHEEHFYYTMGAVFCKIKGFSFEDAIDDCINVKRRATTLEPLQFGSKGEKKKQTDYIDMGKIREEVSGRYLESSVFQKCAEIMAISSVPGEALTDILAILGGYFGADRAYIIEIFEESVLCNTYEWCAQEVSCEKDNLQHIPLSDVPTFQNAYDSKKLFVMYSVNENSSSEAEKKILQAQGISSLIICPLIDNDRVIGFLGVDNPTIIDDQNMLAAVSQIVSSELTKYSLLKRECDMRQNDMISGAKSRSKLIEVIGQINVEAVSSVSVFTSNIIGLDDINKKYGIARGDEILRITANILKKNFEEQNVYRYGDSIFLVIATDISSKAFYEKAEAAASELNNMGGFSVAIGYTWSEKAVDIDSVISNAHILMLAAREKIKLQRSDGSRPRASILETKLLNALKNGKAFIYLQPKYELRTNNVCGAEALIRMCDDEGKIVSPLSFVPLLEEMRLIHHVDHFVLKQAVECLARWRREGKEPLTISLNYSRSTLLEPQEAEHISDMCEEYGVDKNCIEIEITESLGDMDSERLALVSKSFQNKGIKLSLDDFGAKYSS